MKNKNALQGDMDIMSIHICVHFGLRSSDNCLLYINEVLYRILHSESKGEWRERGIITLHV
jgi:hypothetical protein